jgi:hypothetical protein
MKAVSSMVLQAFAQSFPLQPISPLDIFPQKTDNLAINKQ